MNDDPVVLLVAVVVVHVRTHASTFRGRMGVCVRHGIPIRQEGLDKQKENKLGQR